MSAVPDMAGIVLVKHPSGDGLAVYKDARLLKAGHNDDVLEWLVEDSGLLPVVVVENDFLVPGGRGWQAHELLRDVARDHGSETEVRHPEVFVQLTGEDGNAFFIASRVRTALKRAGVPEQECREFFDEALSGDYDHLLQTAMKWVDVG